MTDNVTGMSPEIERALLQALACREDRKHAEHALEALRRKETDAIEHLQHLVGTQPPAAP
jgi:hypothetical protein